MAVGAFPGTFNPPTVAHLAIAKAALHQCALDRVELVVSRRPLGKLDLPGPVFEHRLALLGEVVAARPWLGLSVTRARLIADVADGYDVVVLGADKWSQVVDPAWYGGSAESRDAALARLPAVALAPRLGHPAPPSAQLLDVAIDHHQVSSTEARSGRVEWMLAEAAAFDGATGAWSDPARYRNWLRAQSQSSALDAVRRLARSSSGEAPAEGG